MILTLKVTIKDEGEAYGAEPWFWDSTWQYTSEQGVIDALHKCARELAADLDEDECAETN